MTGKERGKRAKAGKLLTRFLEEIAEEQTELGDGEELITKAEALARLIWKRALGYTDSDVKTGVDTVYAPESSKINIIFERIEGKAPMAGTEKADKLTVSERIKEVGKKRITQAGGYKPRKA